MVDNTIHKRMDWLVYEIIKYRYLTIYCNNEMFSLEQYTMRMDELKNLEKQYPEYKRPCSPTGYHGFVENHALQAFGVRTWGELKRTWDLLKVDQ